MPDIWQILGIKPGDLGAGIAGGTAAAIFARKTGVPAFIGTIVLGGLTSAYVTTLAVSYVGTLGGSVGFFIGLSAWTICEGIRTWVQKMMPPSTKGGPDVN